MVAAFIRPGKGPFQILGLSALQALFFDVSATASGGVGSLLLPWLWGSLRNLWTGSVIYLRAGGYGSDCQAEQLQDTRIITVRALSLVLKGELFFSGKRRDFADKGESTRLCFQLDSA